MQLIFSADFPDLSSLPVNLMKMNVGDMGLVLAVVLLVLGESSIRAQESSPVLFDSVSAGVFVTCAISTEKDLYCFGNNDDGAVGDGTQETRTAPTLVAGEGEWCKISGGDWHVSGTKCNGEGYSWGYNGGRLGIGKEDPVQATTPQVRIVFRCLFLGIQCAHWMTGKYIFNVLMV